MFRSCFESHLKAIFEVDKIIYDDVDVGNEKGALYVQIMSIKPIPQNGKIYFRVVGTLGINEEAVTYKYGYLKQRCQLAKREHTKFFDFGSVEQNVNFSEYNDFFIKPKLDFVYRVSLPYNPPAGRILYEKINWLFSWMKGILKK